MTTTNPTPSSTPATPAPKTRGIQPGQVARAGAPDKLEKVLQAAMKKALARATQDLVLPDGKVLEFRSGFGHDEIKAILKTRGLVFDDLAMAGYMPDGGIWSIVDTATKRRKPFLAVEAKHQGGDGNAIERWHKNYTISKILAPDMSYFTFCTGEGTRANGPIIKALNVALAEYAISKQTPDVRTWNRRYVTGPSMFSAETGFDEAFIENVLYDAILQGAAHCRSS